VRPSDTVARFGGDEFVVLCEELASEADVVHIAGRLSEALAAPLVLDGRQVYPSASVGIALASTGATDAEGLVRDADAAMYLAKDRGRSRYEIFDTEMRQRSLARLDLEADLRRAIERDELDVWYQPVVSLDDERVSGLEALVRWNHPTRGLLLPSEFVGVAEETGLISGLGKRVLHRAAADVGRWRAAGCFAAHESFVLSVNLSGRELCQPDLLAMVKDALADAAEDGPTFCVEITESVLMDDTQAATSALTDLRDLGVGLGVDDFGTGYSSLLYLRRFPVQLLKLDRFFITGLTDNPEDAAIVEGVVGLAHSLGLLAVAEGVETAEQVAALKAMGCDLAQGFYWSAPVPAASVPALLSGGAPLTASAGGRCRVVLVDADGLLLAGALPSAGSFDVVGQAADGTEGVALAAALQPDLVLVDLGGVSALPQILAAAPAARVVVVDTTGPPDHLHAQLRALAPA
jgi:predicted signal transduction protein with EAL and GGDEF domain